MIKRNAILTKIEIVIEAGRFKNVPIKFEVRVMAVAEGYAMVRRPKCLPFVCSVKDLEYIK